MLSRAELRRREYCARINRVMDYVQNHLDGDLALARLAREAGFSAFHFHRVFRGAVGETLGDFIRRVRLERAASMLVWNPAKAVTAVAFDCGFASSAAFARAFRARFGLSPSAYRAQGKDGKANRKSGTTRRKEGKAGGARTCYNRAMKPEKKLPMTVEVKQMPELPVAYIRHTGPYNHIGQAIGRLCAWAGPRGLLSRPGALVLAVYHDDPDVTEPAKLRSSACVTVPPGTAVDGDIGLMTVPGGLFAVARFEVGETEFVQAWNQLMGDWMPESGYQSDDRMCYEVYRNDPTDHPQYKHVIDICEPIRPL